MVRKVEKWSSKPREEGLETPRTVWLRKDVAASLDMFQREYKAKFGKRITTKALLNEALFDLLMRKKQELLHGESVPYNQTHYDPESGETKRNPI